MNNWIIYVISVNCVASRAYSSPWRTQGGSSQEHVSLMPYELRTQTFKKKYDTLSLSQKNWKQIRSQFCTCHNSSAVATCTKLQLICSFELKITAKWIFTRFQLWPCEPFVRWDLWQVSLNSLKSKTIKFAPKLMSRHTIFLYISSFSI